MGAGISARRIISHADRRAMNMDDKKQPDVEVIACNRFQVGPVAVSITFGRITPTRRCSCCGAKDHTKLECVFWKP